MLVVRALGYKSQDILINTTKQLEEISTRIPCGPALNIPCLAIGDGKKVCHKVCQVFILGDGR